MKRPFATVGFTGFSALLLLFFLGRTDAAYCVFFVAGATVVIYLLCNKSRQTAFVPVCLITVAAACLLFLSFEEKKSFTQSFAGNTVKVQAVVSEAPYTRKDTARCYCVLKLISLDGQRAKGKLRLSFSAENDIIETDSLDIGNTVCFTGKVYIPGEDEKSIGRYFTGENILLGAYGAKKLSVTEPSCRGISHYFHIIRSFAVGRLRYGFSDKTAGLLAGILTGDKSCLDDSLYEAFRETGVAHLMAVSGLHLSVWVFSLGSVIHENRKTAKVKYALLIFAVVFIMLLAGMSESVKRAGFMCLAFLLGKLSRRRSDSLNNLGVALAVMMLYNPACVLSISLQLSFLSTLGILTLGKLFTERNEELFGGKEINTLTKKIVRYTADMFFISISVLVFTLPVLIYSFGGISTVSAWVNILISPVVTPLLLLSGLYVILFPFTFVSYPIALFVKLASEYVIFVTSGFSGMKNAFLLFERESLLLFIAAAVLVCGLCFLMLEKGFRGKRGAVFLTILLSFGLIAFNEDSRTPSVKIHLVSYGNAFAVGAEKDKRTVLLSELEEYEKGLFSSYLDKKGAELYALSEGSKLQRCRDGKYLLAEDLGFSENEKLEACGEILKTELYGKYICIFSGEALQYEGRCDIIIEMLADDVAVGIGERSFSLNDEGIITIKLTKDGKITLTGENSWQNLMKSS